MIHLRLALRHLLKRKAYTAINVAGLAVGLACCLLIGLYVRQELSYDRFHEQADRIYRVVLDEHTERGVARKAVTAGYVGPLLQETLGGVERAVRLGPMNMLLQRGAHRFRERAVLWADASVFDVFSFHLLRGDSRTALVAPHSLVLTEATARKYFGDADPLGQPILVDNTTSYTVTGVVAAPPANSHLQFDLLASMATVEADHPDWLEDGDAEWVSTYVLTADEHGARAVAAGLPGVLDRHLGTRMREAGEAHVLALQPLADVYLDATRSQPLGRVGSRANVYLFACIAVFILLLAGVNFVNLSTARAAERAKEVGVRKAVGAGRGQLARQFLAEAVMLSAGAGGLALVLAELALPAFRALAGTSLDVHLLADPRVMLVLAATALLVGVLAGSYPAFVLSGYRPVAVLKGSFQTPRGGVRLRRSLVVFQLGISIVLLAATLTVSRQLTFMQHRDLGFDREQMLVLDFGGDSDVVRQYEALKQALAAQPGVAGASASSDVPGTSRIPASTLVQDAQGVFQEAMMVPYMVDHDFIGHFGMELVAGRSFSRAFPADSSLAMVVNEAAVRALGYASPGEVIGRRYRQWGREGEIVGVVRDFHYRSLHQAVAPMTMRVAPVDFRFLTLHLQTAELPRTLASLEEQWRRLVPHLPFDYTFLDERFAAQYRAEERFGRLFSVFAALAFGIACLGLFGLASLATIQRRKEIGIRKVLGAGAPGLVALLSQDAIRLVALAFVLAVPVAFLAMNRWLAGFAYRIDLSPAIFLLAGLAALLAALAAVGYQSIRAATANPVDALRSE